MIDRGYRFGVDVSARRAHKQVQVDEAAAPFEQFQPLPAPTGSPPFRLDLASVVSDPASSLGFHVVGDSGGVLDPNPQAAVAAAMVADLDFGVAFAYSVGDVVYFNGEHDEFLPQFYEPYDTYPRPIFAIPGNHDGDPFNPSIASLEAFVENLCAASPEITRDAGDMHRTAMTQPNVYWTLSCALATIVGLYTNVPSGGVVKDDQAAWLVSELQAAPTDRALFVALHHPPFSIDSHHGGSRKMGTVLDAAFSEAGRWPDVVLAGHVHDYQRFTRSDSPHPVTYAVVGNSGYHNLHSFAPGAQVGEEVAPGVTFEAGFDDRWGFLRVEVTETDITGTMVGVPRQGAPSVVDGWTQAIAR